MDYEVGDRWNGSTPALYDRMDEALATDEEAAVATIVGVEGSAFRRPGAKMVIPRDGGTHGAITPGCLEETILDVAQSVLEDGAASVRTYDFTNDDEWGVGLGCNGVIDVLTEPLDASWGDALAAVSDDRSVTMATVTETSDDSIPEGSRCFVEADGAVCPASNRAPLPDRLVDADRLAETPDGTTVTLTEGDESIEVFVDRLEPPAELLVFGWQLDVQPVTKLAREAGFRVTVAAGRGAYADADTFPHADRVVSTHPSDLDDVISVPERTYAVIMSHNFVDDRIAVEALLRTDVPYIGLMGPRKRFEEMQSASEADGRSFASDELDRVATPVGLDLGGDDLSTVALSIVSEAVAVRNEESGGRLTQKAGPIHSRPEPPSQL